MRGMVQGGIGPALRLHAGLCGGRGILEGVRGFIASILGGDLLPEITFKDATVAGVGGDELGYAYGKEAADIKGDPDGTPHAGPGVELAEVPDSCTHDADGGPPGGRAVTSDGGPAEGTDFASPALGGRPGLHRRHRERRPLRVRHRRSRFSPRGRRGTGQLRVAGREPALRPDAAQDHADGGGHEGACGEPQGSPLGKHPRPGAPHRRPPKTARTTALRPSPSPRPHRSGRTPRPLPRPQRRRPTCRTPHTPSPAVRRRAPRGRRLARVRGRDGARRRAPRRGRSLRCGSGRDRTRDGAGRIAPAEPDEDGEVGSGIPAATIPAATFPMGTTSRATRRTMASAWSRTTRLRSPQTTLVEPDGEGTTPMSPEGYDESRRGSRPTTLRRRCGFRGRVSQRRVPRWGVRRTVRRPRDGPGSRSRRRTEVSGRRPATEDASGPETGDGGTDGGGAPDIAQQDATDPSQAQPDAEQGQDDGVSTDQPQDQPAPTAATTDTTADTTTDGADGARQSPSEGSPDGASGGERDAGSTPDPGQAEAAPDDAPSDDPAAGVARELPSEQRGAGRSATQNRHTPRPEPAASRIAGRDKGDSARRAERRIRRQVARHAERQSERLAKSERRADARARRRITVAERRAERKADRLSRGQARRQAAIAAAQGRSARKDPGRLEPRVSRGVPGGPHGGVPRGALNAARPRRRQRRGPRGGLEPAQRASVRHREAPEDARARAAGGRFGAQGGPRPAVRGAGPRRAYH